MLSQPNPALPPCQYRSTLLSYEMARQTKKRRYELRKRAEAMSATRRRITEATVDLHGTVGPARTTITAVADRAGVQRHTVYRHFPTDEDLFAACSGHFAAINPLPDLEGWRAIAEPERRLAHALDEMYAFYERTEGMWTNIYRDESLVAAIGANLARFREYLAAAAQTLVAGWPARGGQRRVVTAAARHAVDFYTWRSLAREGGLGRAKAVELAAAMVERAASGRR